MKLVFSILTIIMICGHVQARPFVILSGVATTQQQMVIINILSNDLKVPVRNIEKNFENKNCHLKNKTLIQLCFKGFDFYVKYQNKKTLSKTLGRLLAMKSGQQRGEIKNERK